MGQVFIYISWPGVAVHIRGINLDSILVCGKTSFDFSELFFSHLLFRKIENFFAASPWFFLSSLLWTDLAFSALGHAKVAQFSPLQMAESTSPLSLWTIPASLPIYCTALIPFSFPALEHFFIYRA